MKYFIFVFLPLLLFSCSNQNKEIVAEVNGESILLSDLSEVNKQELFDLLNMAYEIKLKALDDVVKKRLLEKEAKNSHLAVDQYLDLYVEMKMNANIDSVRERYGLRSNQTTIVRNQLYASSSESMEGKLALKNKLRSAIIQQLVDSLYGKASIKKYIYPPKQPECVITDLPIHYRGNMKAGVSLIVVSDFNCERCAAFESTLQRIYAEYKGRVKFGFISFADFPTLPALACEAAGRQNKFWEFHDAIFEHKNVTDSTYLFSLAKSKSLNVDQFRKDLKAPDNYKTLDKTMNDLVSKGVFATPTIIINDRLVYMTNSYEELTRLLDNELQ